MAASLAVRVLGSGPSVMLVHGDVAPGPTWKAQEPLAERWRIVIVTRRGFRMSPAAEEQDPEIDARDLEKLLSREPAHCVGFAQGTLGVLHTAIRAPELVRSLTLIEPPVPQDGLDAETLVRADVPVLVLSGGHDRDTEAACDALAKRLAGSREQLSGAGGAVQRTEGFNARLERFLFAAELSTARGGLPSTHPR